MSKRSDDGENGNSDYPSWHPMRPATDAEREVAEQRLQHLREELDKFEFGIAQRWGVDGINQLWRALVGFDEADARIEHVVHQIDIAHGFLQRIADSKNPEFIAGFAAEYNAEPAHLAHAVAERLADRLCEDLEVEPRDRGALIEATAVAVGVDRRGGRGKRAGSGPFLSKPAAADRATAARRVLQLMGIESPADPTRLRR